MRSKPLFVRLEIARLSGVSGCMSYGPSNRSSPFQTVRLLKSNVKKPDHIPLPEPISPSLVQNDETAVACGGSVAVECTCRCQHWQLEAPSCADISAHQFISRASFASDAFCPGSVRGTALSAARPLFKFITQSPKSITRRRKDEVWPAIDSIEDTSAYSPL